MGLVAEMQKTDKVLEIAGTLQQRISSCLEVMDQFMRQNESVVSSFVVAEKRSTLENAESVVDCVASIIGDIIFGLFSYDRRENQAPNSHEKR